MFLIFLAVGYSILGVDSMYVNVYCIHKRTYCKLLKYTYILYFSNIKNVSFLFCCKGFYFGFVFLCFFLNLVSGIAVTTLLITSKLETLEWTIIWCNLKRTWNGFNNHAVKCFWLDSVLVRLITSQTLP